MHEEPSSVFSDIHRKNAWKGSGPSGPGSSLGATHLIRRSLPEVWKELGIRSLCDAPCGDITWIRAITGHLDLYLGIDIVESLMKDNVALKLPPNHLFAVGDLIKDTLPKVDAILCRDCLVHLPLEKACAAISNFKASGSRFLITTTFVAHGQNLEVRMGGWRPLNLERPPFNFPKPLKSIRERELNPDDRYNDKTLAVWDLREVGANLK